jgi:hypothetical protein
MANAKGPGYYKRGSVDVIFDTDIIPYMDLLNIQPYHQ